MNKLHVISGGIMLVLLPFLCAAQDKDKMKEKERHGKTKMKATPSWSAAHHYTGTKDVYFPDYYTFYDPEQGYVYWNNGTWTTSSSVPEFMSGVDMNTARVETITERITTQPQKEYIIYKKRYPAQKVGITVPMPSEQ